jgi:phytoene dehydrogenase-like protein
MSHYYDVVVLGSELAGLCAGGLLARRGFRVLVVRDPADDDAYQAEGHTLYQRPLPIVGLDGPAWKRVLAELNLAQSLRRRVQAQRPAYQVVLPNHRLDCDLERVSAEIERELPRDREALEGFFARGEALSRVLDPLLTQDVTLPPDGFWERRELGRIRPQLPAPDGDVLPGAPPGGPARAFALAPAVLSSDLDPPGPVAALRIADVWRRGAFRLPGGRDVLRRLLEERVQTHSGEVTTQTVAELVIKRGRVAGMVTQPRGETLGCGFLVAGMTTVRLCALLGAQTPRRLTAAAEAMRPAAWRYVQNLVVAAEGLPEGMGENVFVIGDPTRPLDEDNALAIHPFELDAAGRTCLAVVALARSEEAPYLGALGERVRARLIQTVLPFLDRHLVARHAPAEGEGARPMDPVYRAAEPGPLGVGATAHATGLKNVFVVGRQTLPGLGLEGELAAAWGVARVISLSEKKRDPLAREMRIR